MSLRDETCGELWTPYHAFIWWQECDCNRNVQSNILHVSRRDNWNHHKKHTTNNTDCLQKPRHGSINTVATLWDERPDSQSSIPSTASRRVAGSTQSHIQWVLGDLSSGVKQTGRGADFSPSSSAEVQNEWRYTFSPHTPSWCAYGLHYLSAFCKTKIAHKDNLKLHVYQIS